MSESIDGQALKAALAAGVAQVIRSAHQINALNVFPVPDGDTGANMSHTLRRAYAEIADVDCPDASAIAGRFAYGALMGARGNSGTILSQLLRGFADGLAEAPLLKPALLLAGARSAVQRAYDAVTAPAEGTILTVAREACESLHAADLDSASASDLLDLAVCAARQSLADTPKLLPILREAGVVDAGGMGLLCFLQGMQAGADSDIAAGFATAKPALLQTAIAADSYGYDLQFLMRGAGLDIAGIRRDLSALGWSLLVVGDSAAIKVHIHAHNPAPPLDYAIRAGAQLDDIVVENMSLQAQQFQAQEQTKEIAVIAAADGAGFAAVLRELGCARVIDCSGGKPASEDFIAAIHALPQRQLIILPNDSDIIMAARQAAALSSDRQVEVVPTRSVQQGISAMLAFGGAVDSQAQLDETLPAMRSASESIVSIAAARASRSTTMNDLPIREGDYIAIVDGQIRASDIDLATVLLCALSLASDQRELATLYYGAGMTEAQATDLMKRLQAGCAALEYELVYGGQRLYPILVSVE